MESVTSEESNSWYTLWQPVMDQLNELKQWQRQHQQEVTQKQMKHIQSLSEQNVKLNTLMAEDIGGESVEEMRVEESESTVDQSWNNCSSVAYLESSPVVPGIDGKRIKTFEQLLDIRLNGANSDVSDTHQSKPKKPFLRKGEGIKRFEPNNCSAVQKSKTIPKKVGFDDNLSQQTTTRREVRPRFNPQEYVNRKKFHKIEETSVKPKKFLRKVIPLTTKFEKNPKTPVQISRDTSTVAKAVPTTDSELFDYLLKMYDNISADDNEEIEDLRELLDKIESKRKALQKQSGSDGSLTAHNHLFLNKRSEDISKKKVRWSLEEKLTSDESEGEDQNCHLIRPKVGAYSSKLKQQIDELEERLSNLKVAKTTSTNDKSSKKSEELCAPISGELSKLREQIEKLNKRIVNIEAKSYDKLSDCKKTSNRNQNLKCIANKNVKTKPKTIVSANVSVNESQNDTTIEFPNGDKMSVSKDNTIFYVFANGTTQTTHPDGLRITNFPNGQIEKLHKNGVKHITYATGLQRIINPDTSEEVLMTDGTVWRIHSDGSEVLEFADGDREIRTTKYKRREYRNGNIKTLYCDGTEETRYVSGRLRIKDKFGNLMVDSMVRHLDQH